MGGGSLDNAQYLESLGVPSAIAQALVLDLTTAGRAAASGND